MKHTKTTFLFVALAMLLCSCGAGGQSTHPDSSTAPSSSAKDNNVYNIYAVNDFHGSILERQNGSYYEGGLEKVGGYLKAKKDADPEHTIILSSGDMWQGSLESNNNHGLLITEAMNYIGFDASTLGNHDFDYGQEWLLTNKEAANFPFLAANILKWDTEAKKPIPERWEKSDDSVIIEKGGRKFGIVGVIGYGQTTSITSPNVADLTFVDPKSYAQNEATRLKQKGCESIILSIHSSVSTVSNWGGAAQYFDGVFGGHTHSEEKKTTSDGVPMLQGASNGEMISHIELRMKDGGAPQILKYENIMADAKWAKDPGLTAIMNKYLGSDEFQALANKECGTLTGSFTKTTIANAGTKAIYERFAPEYPDLALALENSQRAGISSGKFNYSDLYKATPFMNNIVIAKFKGSDILAEAAYNCTYTGDLNRFTTLDENEYYTIAVIDYIAFHQDYNKNYDYFPSYKEENVLAVVEEYPVDITYDYFKKVGPNISSYDYNGTEKGFGIYKGR